MKFFKKPLLPTLSFVMSAQFCSSLMSPVWVFLFFAMDSGVFPPHTALATRSLWYGITLGISYWIGMLCNIFFGMISDCYGRKKLFLLTLIGFGLTSGLALLAQALHQPCLLAISLIVIGSSFMAVQAGMARVGDIGNPNTRLKDMAYLQCVVSVGATLGPWIGGYLATQSGVTGHLYQLPFIAVIVLSSILLICLHYYPEERATRALHTSLWRSSYFKEIQCILKNPAVRICFMVLILSQFSWSTYYEFAPAILKVLFHANPLEVGRFEGMIALWLIVATAFVLHGLRRFLSSPMLVRLCVLLVLLGVLMALVASLNPSGFFERMLIWLSAIPTAMGDVMLYSVIVTTLSQALDSHLQGKVMGLLYVIIGISWSLSGIWGGVLMSKIHNGPFWFAPVGSLVLLGLLCHQRWLALLTEGVK